MADLKADLDQYLLLQSETKKSYKFALPQLKRPGFLFGQGRSADGEETEAEQLSWVGRFSESCCPTLTRFQRIVAFVVCICLGLLCFVLSTMYIPFLLLKATKFAVLFTFGSIFFILSFVFLHGPAAYLRHTFSSSSAGRLPYTLAYSGSLVGTLYCALALHSAPLTVLFAVGQIAALGWAAVTTSGGLKVVRGLAAVRSATSTLPV